MPAGQASSPTQAADASDDRLATLLRSHRRLFVLTGAGCSTDSGIPDYRDRAGAWKRPPPIAFGPFMAEPLTRARYWARSMIGWRSFGQARPNRAHHALAALEAADRIELLVTQNVDGLHQAANSRAVVDLHGRLDGVRCMQCGARLPRADFQAELEALNPDWRDFVAPVAPDGDADLDGVDFSGFRVPAHAACGGILKPDVVFFGESVPRQRVLAASDALSRADAMLVVGSSLMVYSGYRFALAAAERGIPLVSINRGLTRADALLSFKVEEDCGDALARAVAATVLQPCGISDGA
ncbi:NAD-dependent protein deacetylase [Chitinasiproducens palmae]|nr:NAD-dependent protein deacetylase [Chitinasiproducens palmae]